MGRIAAGQYLRELRAIRGLPRIRVAAQLSVRADTIESTERGWSRINGATLLQWIHCSAVRMTRSEAAGRQRFG